MAAAHELLRRSPPPNSALSEAAEDKFGIVIDAPFKLGKTRRWCKSRFGGFFNDDQCAWHEPTAVARRNKRRRGQPLFVRWVQKGERETARPDAQARAWWHRGEKFASRRQSKGGHVLANERARFGAIIDKQCEGRAARQRFDAERASPREQVEHASAGDRVVVGMHQNIEQQLAKPIGRSAEWPATLGRPRCARAIVRRPRASSMIRKVSTGFPPARSRGCRLPFHLMLRRAKAGRKRSCSNIKRNC